MNRLRRAVLPAAAVTLGSAGAPALAATGPSSTTRPAPTSTTMCDHRHVEHADGHLLGALTRAPSPKIGAFTVSPHKIGPGVIRGRNTARMTTDAAPRPTTRRLVPSVLLIPHAALVAAAAVALLVMNPRPGDPDIGAGLVLLPLWVLGLPWTAVGQFVFHLPGSLLVLSAAGVNLVLHAALARPSRRPLAVVGLTVALLVAAVTVTALQTR